MHGAMACNDPRIRVILVGNFHPRRARGGFYPRERKFEKREKRRENREMYVLDEILLLFVCVCVGRGGGPSLASIGDRAAWERLFILRAPRYSEGLRDIPESWREFTAVVTCRG